MPVAMIDKDVILSDWRQRGFVGGVWIDPPGQEWADYLHDVDELIMVLDGEMEVEMDGDVVRPEYGEEVLIPAGTKHTVRNVGSRTSRWLYSYKRD